MILHPREKISYLRKEYGITQKELGQEEFSQSYIASLENGQRELRDEILLSIWKNFEKILKENNKELSQNINFEWLKRPFAQEKELIYLEKLNVIKNSQNIEELKKIFLDLEEIKEFLSLEEKSFIFHNLAYKFMIFDENNEAYNVYNSIYLIFNEIKDIELLGKIINNFLIIMKKLKNFNRFKNIVDLFENKEEFLEKRIKIYIIDSLSEISFYLGDYEKEFYFLKLLENLSSYKREKILTLNRLELLTDIGKFDDAKKLYKKITEDSFFSPYTENINLAGLKLFMKTDKKALVKKLYNALVENKDEFCKSNKNLIMAKTALYLKKNNDACLFYEKYIECIFSDEINAKNKQEIFESIKFLLNAFKKSDLERAEKIFLKCLKFNEEIKDFTMALLFLEYFVKNKYYEKYFMYNKMIFLKVEENYAE